MIRSSFRELRLLGAVLLALLSATPRAGAQAGLAASGTEPMLRPGDVVRIDVWEATQLSGEISVASDSTLRHPLYRTLKVAGLPLPEVERRLRVHLAQWKQDPQFSIEPMFPVVVTGEVEAPAVYRFGPDVTIERAITLAGGPTRRARLDRVRVFRNGEDTVIDLTGGASQLPVQSGDRIILDRRIDAFRDVLAPAGQLIGSVTSIITFILFLSGQIG